MTDAAGLPKRTAGEKYMYNGRPILIVQNKGLFVLCPCPDMLTIKYLDTDEVIDMENKKDFVKVR